MAIAQVELAGGSQGPLVTPAATAALADSFRKGFITADDIMERVGERSKTKEALDIAQNKQALVEAVDPELIAARQNQQLAAGAQAGTALTLNPLAEQAKTAELKAAIFDAQAKPGGFDLMQTALSKAGFPVSIDPNVGLTDANKAEIIKRFSALNTYTLKRADAEEKIKATETKFFPTEQKLSSGATTKGQLQKLFHQGQEITSDQFKNWATEAEALKRTPFSQWYALQSTQPGQVAAPAPVIQPVAVPAPALVIEPAIAAQQRAQLMNQGVPNAASLSDQQVAALVQPRVAAPPSPAPVPVAVAPATPQIGQTAPGVGIVTSVEAAPAPVIVRPTEGQQRALLAIPRFQEANAALQNLQSKNYDPTSWGSWVDSYLPQVIKSGDRKEFETAISAWAQGLLRLESGAAITPKEEGWYARTFFPQVNDTATVLKQKEALRHSVEGMVAEIGSAGEIGPDLKARAQNVFQAAETFNVPGAPAAPAGGSPSENTAVIGGKTYKVRTEPSGQKRYFLVQ